MAAKRVHEKCLISGRNTQSWFCALKPPPQDTVGLLPPKAFSYSKRHPAPSRWSELASVCSSSGMTRSPVCASYQPTRTSCILSVVLNLYRAQAAVQGAGAEPSSTSLFLSLPSHFILQGQGFKRNRALRLWIPACVQVRWKQNRQYAPHLLVDFL